jgi:hypothetical protein
VILEGDAGSLSDVGELGDEFAFTLYDVHGEELLAFVYATEHDARAAHKMMSEALWRAMAICPTKEPTGFVAVPVVSANSKIGQSDADA